MSVDLACQEKPDVWFSESPLLIEIAKNACNECPLKTQCYDLAVFNGEEFGIWGGVNFNKQSSERPDVEPEIKMCRAKKHVLPNGKGKCSECSNERNKRYEAKRKGKRDYGPYRRQEVGDTCKNGHLISGENVKIREQDGAVCCKECSSPNHKFKNARGNSYHKAGAFN